MSSPVSCGTSIGAGLAAGRVVTDTVVGAGAADTTETVPAGASAAIPPVDRAEVTLGDWGAAAPAAGAAADTAGLAPAAAGAAARGEALAAGLAAACAAALWGGALDGAAAPTPADGLLTVTGAAAKPPCRGRPRMTSDSPTVTTSRAAATDVRARRNPPKDPLSASGRIRRGPIAKERGTACCGSPPSMRFSD